MQSQSLKTYHWQNRVLIVTVRSDEKAFQEQLKALKAEERELIDRDLVLLLLDQKSLRLYNGQQSLINVSQLRKELNIDLDFEGVILIGKDGGVKMREKFQVDPKKIFDLIDTMPMRRTEMKN